MTSTEAGEILYPQLASWNQEFQFLEDAECQKSSHNDATPIHELLKFLFNELLSFNLRSRSHFILSVN
jgi:hypothetical protein